MVRACFSLVLCLLLANCGPAEETPSPLQDLPAQDGLNVIVISFDALRADALGVYGSPRETSPNIDAFARQCIVFDKAYSVAPVTPTSFAAAFTGLLPMRVFHGWKLSWDDTLARRFSQAGYETAAFLNNAQLARERNFHSGFSLYEHYSHSQDEVILESSSKWLYENSQRRLFAWIHFIKPHGPYLYRDIAAHLYDGTYEGEFQTTSGNQFAPDDPQEIARIKSLYEGEVFYVDTLFGELIQRLREAGLLESSIVLITSDHGEEFNEHGGFQHGRLTEEHVRIPLLLYHPSLRTHRRSSVLASNVDIFPTLLGLAGIEFDEPLDGRDLTRISQEPQWIAGVQMTGADERALSLRRDRQKLIRTCLPDPASVLYDLAADAGEHDDLSLRTPMEAKRLYRDLGTILGGEPCAAMQKAVQGADPTVGMTEENIEALKALGYLGD